MTFAVPDAVARYLAAEAAKDVGAISRSFVEDGIVRDEGREYRRRDAIRAWKMAADTKYNYVLAALRVRSEGKKVTMRARLTGDFPG